MNFFEELISKLSVKTIGTHLANYASLYTKPLKTWRKVISNRKDGYDLMILHLIYYCIFLFLIIKNITTTISLVLLEAVITIIPTLVFITPFLLFVKLYKKKIRWTKMFRLFLILKLQFIPVFIYHTLQ